MKNPIHKRVIVIVLSAFIFSTVSAQSLRIQYDFIKDEVRFFKTSPGDKVGKEISSPIVGRNKMVQVEVINFNKFVYAANSTYTSKTVTETSDKNFLSIITPLIMPAGGGTFFSSLGGTLPDEVTRGGLLASREASASFTSLQASYQQLVTLQSNYENTDYVIKKLHDLKYNRYLPTDTIVKMSDYLVQQIFDKKAVTTQDFASAIVQFNTTMKSSVNNFNMASSRFLNAYHDFEEDMEGEDFEGKGLDNTVRQFKTEVNSAVQKVDVAALTAKMDYLETIYTSIKSTSFTFNSSYAANEDEVSLLLNFYVNPTNADGDLTQADLQNLDQLVKVKDKTIKIVVRGDVKINSSVGLAFPQFSDNTEFINKDSFIVSQSGSAYAPNLAAYINFYPYSGRMVNVGGTFGIGVPLNDATRSVNMFLGGTALFGSDSRVNLHGGFTLGQVSSLGEAYKAGDKLLSATQEVPLRKTWEWGGFIGISFNMTTTK